MQRACRVGSSDVEVQTLRTAQACGAPGRLEDPAGHLVDRGVSVRAEGRVHGTQRHRGALVGGPVHEDQAVGALVPLGAAVRAGSDEVVVFEIDERSRPGVRGLVGRPRRGVVDREPLAVGARREVATAWIDVLLIGRARVRRTGDRDAQACERVEIGEVLLSAAIECDVGVAPARTGREDANDRIRRGLLRHHAEGLATIDRAEPRAALRSRPRRTTDEDASLNVDRDVRLAVGVYRIHHRRYSERDRGRGRADRS